MKEISDKYYWRFKAIQENVDFIRRVKSLKDRLKQWDTPVPEEGFANELGYIKFCEAVSTIFQDWHRSKGNKLTLELLDVENVNNPPFDIRSLLKHILQDFGFDENDDINYTYIKRLIFFKHTDFRSGVHLHIRLNEKTNEPEVLLKLYPHITQDELKSKELWSLIKKKLAVVYGEVTSRNRDRTNFKRDLKFLRIYQKAIQERGVSEKRAFSLVQSTNPSSPYRKEIEKILEFYEEEIDDQALVKVIRRQKKEYQGLFLFST